MGNRLLSKGDPTHDNICKEVTVIVDRFGEVVSIEANRYIMVDELHSIRNRIFRSNDEADYTVVAYVFCNGRIAFYNDRVAERFTSEELRQYLLEYILPLPTLDFL